jgi:hypothetical protein
MSYKVFESHGYFSYPLFLPQIAQKGVKAIYN